LPKEARRLRPLCVCWEEEDDHHHHHHHNDDYYEMDVSRWVVIYPVYINSKKTLAEGRRISTSKACDNPTVVEISDCCQYLKLPCAIELDKVYSRDNMQRGRVRVQLKREDKSLVNPAVPSRKVLLMRVAELVGKLQSRHKKPEPTASTSGSTAPAGKSGKGGKKKK
jgi:signal recognition particle subunit SRP19